MDTWPIQKEGERDRIGSPGRRVGAWSGGGGGRKGEGRKGTDNREWKRVDMWKGAGERIRGVEGSMKRGRIGGKKGQVG